MIKKERKKRIWELDFLRGFAIIMVVLDHAFFDFAVLFSGWGECGSPLLEFLNSFANDYLYGELREFWHPVFIFIFFTVSGISTGLSKNNLFRGLKLWVVACGLTLVTFIVSEIIEENVLILFGVLHSLALVILIYSIFELLVTFVFRLYEKKKGILENKKKSAIKSLACVAVVIVGLIINFKFNIRIRDIEGTNQWKENVLPVTGMFFYSKTWQTADYFPIFPYIVYFFLGAAISYFYREKKSLLPYLDGTWHNIFTVFGRHSLGMYLMGQVVAIATGLILSYAIIGSFFV